MIISRTKKLEALNNFTKLVGDDPVLAYLMGFLAGQVDRVHFVRDLRGADTVSYTHLGTALHHAIDSLIALGIRCV